MEAAGSVGVDLLSAVTISPAQPSPAQPSRAQAVDPNEGSGDFIEEIDAGGEVTFAHADDVAGHQDRVVVAGACSVWVVAEDAPVHLAPACEADEFDLAFEQASAAGEVED